MAYNDAAAIILLTIMSLTHVGDSSSGIAKNAITPIANNMYMAHVRNIASIFMLLCLFVFLKAQQGPDAHVR